MNFFEKILNPIPVPRVVKVAQYFDTEHLEGDLTDYVGAQIKAIPAYQRIQPGQRIAVTGGSRGIHRVAEVTRIVCGLVKEKGAEPFVIPAMGSHGGATAEGQIKMLESIGITEDSVGAPIRATMDTEQIGTFDLGRSIPVHMDTYAHNADGIILINRVKSHPSFRAKYESGLMKMMAIGLGKQFGAQNYHQLGYGSFPGIIEAAGRLVLQQENILFGVALLENSSSKLRKVVCLAAEEIPEKEPELLKESYQYLARPFFTDADVLIVRDIGKNISGACCDVNVSGRFNNEYYHNEMKITRVAFLRLTPQSHGNASGVGVADIITNGLYHDIDLLQSYPNGLTTGSTIAYKIPMIMPTEEMAVKAAIKTCLIPDYSEVRLCLMESSKNLDRFYVTENLLQQAAGSGVKTEVVSGPMHVPFTDTGALALEF